MRSSSELQTPPPPVTPRRRGMSLSLSFLICKMGTSRGRWLLHCLCGQLRHRASSGAAWPLVERSRELCACFCKNCSTVTCPERRSVPPAAIRLRKFSLGEGRGCLRSVLSPARRPALAFLLVSDLGGRDDRPTQSVAGPSVLTTRACSTVGAAWDSPSPGKNCDCFQAGLFQGEAAWQLGPAGSLRTMGNPSIKITPPTAGRCGNRETAGVVGCWRGVTRGHSGRWARGRRSSRRSCESPCCFCFGIVMK